MLGRALLSTVLLLWLAQPTLQGGTGYKPQNGGLGQMFMPFKGYNLGAQHGNAYQPNTKAQGNGPAALQPKGNGAKGYGAAQAAGNNAKPSGPYKGYGAAPAALTNGNGAKPNGPYKGYGAALGDNGAKANGYGAVPATFRNGNGAKPNGYGNGGKPNGFGTFPAAAKANRGYGPSPVASKEQGPKSNGYSPFTSNGQQAKPNPNGGYGSKPNKPGYGAQPSYGGFGAGMRMAPQMANKGRGGYGKGNGFGQADSSFAGYRSRPAFYPQAGAGQGGGYMNGGKAAKPGYGGGALAPSGRPAKPNGYGPVSSGPNAQGAKPTGYGGYPHSGAIKGPKPGYGGLPTGYGQRPNVYGGYPNGGAKAPKPGYGAGAGAGNGGASNGQGAKPNGYGVPADLPKMKPGYGPVTNGNEKGPKGKSLSPEAPSLPSVTGYTKGAVPPAEPEPTVGVPTALLPTKGMASHVMKWKGPKPQVPFVSQGYPSNPVVPEQAPVMPQSNAPKPVQYIPQGQAVIPDLKPLIPQGKGPKPAVQPSPEIPQGNPQKPVAPALSPLALQEKNPKPITQVPQPVASVPVALKPGVLQPQAKGPKPIAPGPEIPQKKDPKPVVPEAAAPWTPSPQLALEATPALPQLKSPKVANPDCGVSGQWTKLPSPGYGPGPWYPNNGGAKASKPGPGYGSKPNQPGYVNPGAGYGYGNGAAGLGEVNKGKSGGAGQLPYNGAPIIPARMDGISPIEPQTAELGPQAKSGHAYGGSYGAQPMGLDSEGTPQIRYGIGGLIFGGSPTGYNSNPYGKYGNPYAAQPYASKAAGNYNPLGFNPKSAKYSPYGGQQLGLSGNVGNTGKYGQNFGPYAPEPISLGGNPSLPFEALGPVTDGQSIDQPAVQYEAPSIDGVKSVDQFGEGDVQPQPFAPLVDGVGEAPASYMKGGVQAEAVSLPAAPTDAPLTGSEVSLGNPAYSPMGTATDAVTQQHVPVQQNLKGPQLPQSWTGGKESKHNLKGFFGNGYHG